MGKFQNDKTPKNAFWTISRNWFELMVRNRAGKYPESEPVAEATVHLTVL